MSDYYDLGAYSRPVTTASAQAQRWFDRGLIWAFAFNHLEAVRCFERAAQADPDCAMAYWGMGYSGGPYYNKQWHRFDPKDLRRTLSNAHSATQRAVELAAAASPVEQALIQALSRRYAAPEPPTDFGAWNDDYADAMRAVHAQFATDPDVCTLFADAMMNRTPWMLWDLNTGEPVEGADTVEAIAVIEAAFAHIEADRLAPHPGLLHLYIHLLEMSPTPEKALPAANALRELAPEAGHLRHMPTHIDVQCGHYQQVVTSNSAAIETDHKFMQREGAMTFHALSRAHNFHFKLYGAMLLGQYAQAMSAAQGMVDTIPDALLRVESPPMADWLEGYVAMKVHAQIRFGRWADIIAEPLPEDRELYCATTAMLHYGKTLAYAVLQEVEAAQEEKLRFEAAVENVPLSRTVFNNTCQDLLAIATRMSSGELEYRKSNHAVAFEHLRAAVYLSDNLPYDEPWGWMQPARHALGALLLEQGQVEEAEAVYRADLGLDESVHRPCRHPDNVWALHGLHEALLRQQRGAEAANVAPRLEAALARTDVPIRASCLCRRVA